MKQNDRHIKLAASNYAGTLRVLSGLHVNLEEGKATSWVTVTRTGSFTDPRYGKFDITRSMLLSMVDNFNKGTYGQDIFVDKAHAPSEGAAAKILKLSVEGDRLRALVEWTSFGIDLVKNKGYRYLSAEYHENWQDNEGGGKHGPVLLGAGLVIRPCIKRLDPIQLSEASGDVPTFVHPTLAIELTQEITMKFAELIKALKEKLASFKLADAVVDSLVATATKSIENFTDEAQAKIMLAAFEDSGKKLAEQIGDKVVQLSIAVPNLGGGLTADDVKKLMADESARQLSATKALAEKQGANVKLLSDAIGAVKDFDDTLRKELLDAVSDLVTADMSAEQVKKLADAQIMQGNRLQAARKLSGLGYQVRGSAHIVVDSSNEVKKLQEIADRRLGIAGTPDSRRFSATGGALQEANRVLAEQVLACYDAANGHRLHAEHRLLAAGDSLVSDVAVPATFERTVIREALFSLVGLQFVDAAAVEFGATTQIPYSYRDTTAAGVGNVRKYEGQGIARAGVKQAMDTAYVLPQKLAFEVSDELRYLTANGQLVNWDAVAENSRNAIRIVGEDTEQLIFNEQLNASDQYAVTAVTDEAVATADGTKTIFPLARFPMVRPKSVYDLQGNLVGSTLYGITVKTNAVARTQWDGTGTQAAGLYWWADYNLGEIHFVDKDGAPSAPTNTHAVVASYSYTTNVYKFDTDQGSVATDVFWDTLLYRYGLRKSVIEDQRAYQASFGLMSGTVMTMIEQARSFIESGARNGTNLDSLGNLGQVKGVPNFKSYAPGLAMADQRIIIGQRGLTRFRVAKGWTMGALQDQRDANGRFTGKKEAYGDQFIFLHTPAPLKAGLTSIALYGGAARVAR